MSEIQFALALAHQRHRFRIDQQIGNETPAAWTENATDLGEIISHGFRKEMRKNRSQEDEIEGIVFVRKAKILWLVFAQGIVKLIVQVSHCKMEVRKTAGDVLGTPIHTRCGGVEAVVLSLRR